MMNRTDSAPVRRTSLEGVLRHPNTPPIALLGAITVASWLWILALANINGPGAWLMARAGMRRTRFSSGSCGP